MLDTTQIIILAAGKGTRMGGDMPKALTALGQQSMLEHLLDTVETLGLTHPPIAVVGYKKELVIKQVGTRALFAEQVEQKGTGHAVSSALPLIGPNITQVVVLYADQPFVSKDTIQALVEAQRTTERPLVIATATINDPELFRNQFYNFGRIVRNNDGDIAAIVEFKDASEEVRAIHEVNPAYFCIHRQWLARSLSELKNDNSQEEYYLTDLVKIAFGQSETIPSVAISEREALGANTPEQLAVLERYL